MVLPTELSGTAHEGGGDARVDEGGAAQVDGKWAGRQPRGCLQGLSELLCARDVVLTDELDATARGHACTSSRQGLSDVPCMQYR